MRRGITRALAATVLAGATAFTAVTPAAAHDLGTDRFQVTLRTVSAHFEDVGPKGPSVGDTFTFSDNVFHRGQRVGRDDGNCHVTRRGPGSLAFQCAVTVTLRGRGQITLQGLFAFRRGRPGNATDLAITGGTGGYNGASGTATLIDRRGEPARLRFDMR